LLQRTTARALGPLLPSPTCSLPSSSPKSEPIARTFLEQHLIDNGFAVLSRPEDGRPHLVLTGDPEAVDAWRGDVPVIMLGREEADVIDRIRALQRGFDDYGETACPSASSTAGGRDGPLGFSAASRLAT